MLGFSWYEDLDVSLLKREYRKKVQIFVDVMLFSLMFQLLMVTVAECGVVYI